MIYADLVVWASLQVYSFLRLEVSKLTNKELASQQQQQFRLKRIAEQSRAEQMESPQGNAMLEMLSRCVCCTFALFADFLSERFALN